MSDQTPGGFPYRQHPHELCGSNTERQEVGDPGHCEDCCSVGHVVAHPEIGCGDVGCYRTHGPDAEPYVSQKPDADTVPFDLHTSPARGLVVKVDGAFYPAQVHIVGRQMDELPADAVKLGDAEAWKRAVLEELAEVDDFDPITAYDALEAIRAIAEGETR